MPDFEVITVKETPYLYVSRSCSVAPDDVSANMGAALQEVLDFMQAAGILPSGPPMSVYYDYGMDRVTFRAGFQVARTDLEKAAKGVLADVTPAGRALRFVHRGPYATLRDDYEKMMKYMADNAMEAGVPSWEIYLDDAGEVPEEELLTECYVALR